MILEEVLEKRGGNYTQVFEDMEKLDFQKTDNIKKSLFDAVLNSENNELIQFHFKFLKAKKIIIQQFKLLTKDILEFILESDIPLQSFIQKNLNIILTLGPESLDLSDEQKEIEKSNKFKF